MVVRVCRLALVLLLLAIPLIAASTQPPRDLKLVGDHWTPYDSPSPWTYPAASKFHTIAQGDTLWELARFYLGDPYLWPQLWEKNTYITDAHWIYPGDTILIDQEAMPADTLTTEPMEMLEPEEPAPVPVEEDRLAPPLPLGSVSDIYCYGYLGELNEPLPNQINAFEDTETRYIEGALEQSIGGATDDIVYIQGGTATGIAAGETYIIVEPEEIVRDPRTRKVIGRHYAYRGQVRILCASDDQATAIVTKACSVILVGQKLKPLPQIPIPLARMMPVQRHCEDHTAKSSGSIVNAKDFKYSLGEGSVVEIDLGWEDFIQPGDFLTIYRDNRIAGEPRKILGQLGILTTEPHTATGRIVEMRYSMEVGDRVEIK